MKRLFISFIIVILLTVTTIFLIAGNSLSTTDNQETVINKLLNVKSKAEMERIAEANNSNIVTLNQNFLQVLREELNEDAAKVMISFFCNPKLKRKYKIKGCMLEGVLNIIVKSPSFSIEQKEYVIKSRIAQKNLPLLHAINSGLNITSLLGAKTPVNNSSQVSTTNNKQIHNDQVNINIGEFGGNTGDLYDDLSFNRNIY